MNTTMERATFARLLAGFVGLAMLASAGTLALTQAPAPAAGRTLTVEPASDLGDQVVHVSWAGFTPTDSLGGHAVLLFQCKANPTKLADCFAEAPFPDLANGTRQVGRTADDGTGSVNFEIRGAAKLPDLGCNATTPCSVLAYENDGISVPADSLPTTATIAPITFAPSQADCPSVTNFDLRGDGEASSAGLFYHWAALRCTGDNPLILDYTETSSNQGRDNALSNLVDMGLTSEAARTEEKALHPDAPDFNYAPIDLTAVTVVLNMKDPFTGEKLTDVTLTPRLVARLITDTDVAGFFADPELRTLNPTVRFPTVSGGEPLLRAERNADTKILTTWVSKDAGAQKFLDNKDDWGVGRNPAYNGYTYPQDLFENVGQSGQFLPRAGEEEVAKRMFYGVQPNGNAPERTDEVGLIGVVDLPTAKRFGLPTAKIMNAAGQAVAPTEESILAGYKEMTKGPDGTLVSNPEASDAAAYPLVKIDYAMVAKNLAPDAKRTKMQAFLGYAAGDGQTVLPAGYVALPDELKKATTDIAATYKVADQTTTTTSTTTTIADSGGSFTGDGSGSGSGIDSGSGSSGNGSGGTGTGTGGKGGTTGGGTKKGGGSSGGHSGITLPALPISRATAVAPVLLLSAGAALLYWAFGGLGSRLRRRRRGASA